jgi:predicted ABC-type ATPase
VSCEGFLHALDRVLAADKPVILVLAGSNGAGKSTFFDLYLSRLGLTFVNADRIAQALDPNDPLAVSYEAARVADIVRHELVDQRQSFCMETVFSDPAGSKLQFLREAQACGYTVVFLYFRLADAALSAARVMQRVARGGHDVPDEKLAARFVRTLRNAAAALTFVDLALVIDNSSAREPYRVVEQWEGGILQRAGNL